MSFEMPKVNKEKIESESKLTPAQKSALMNFNKVIDRAGLNIFNIYKKYGLDKPGQAESATVEVKVQAEKEVAAELENLKKAFDQERTRGFQEKSFGDLNEYMSVVEEVGDTYRAGKEKEIDELIKMGGDSPMIKIDNYRISALEFLQEQGKTDGFLAPLIKDKSSTIKEKLN